jgi:hypothetical protein
MMATWRAEFFDKPDDKVPSQSVVIEAKDEDEAAERAGAAMGASLRADLTRVILKSPN